MTHTLTKLVAATAILATTACAQTMWTKPGATQETFNQDKAFCQMTALSGAGLSTDMASAGLAGIHQQQIATLCMQSKGYTQVSQ